MEEKNKKTMREDGKTEAKEKHEKEMKKEETKKDKTEKKEEVNDSDEKSGKKEDKKEITKKDKAVARGSSIHASKKHSMYICSFIKNRSIDDAMSDLEKVIKLKKAIPFKGEIPHRKGMMSGRYPVKASKEFIRILKGLKGNCTVNGMDLDRTIITLAYASWASRPMRRNGVQGKRVNVIIEAREREARK